jgi:hypothetical protein
MIKPQPLPNVAIWKLFVSDINAPTFQIACDREGNLQASVTPPRVPELLLSATNLCWGMYREKSEPLTSETE